MEQLKSWHLFFRSKNFRSHFFSFSYNFQWKFSISKIFEKNLKFHFFENFRDRKKSKIFIENCMKMKIFEIEKNRNFLISTKIFFWLWMLQLFSFFIKVVDFFSKLILFPRGSRWTQNWNRLRAVRCRCKKKWQVATFQIYILNFLRSPSWLGPPAPVGSIIVKGIRL